MKIGAMNHPARNSLEEIEWIGSNGFDFVDFTLEPPAADPDQIDPRAIRAALKRHGLGVVAHTAWFIPIGSPFGSVREASLTEFQRALGAAHQIGATVMNVHYGKSPGFFSKEQVIGWHVEVLSRLCQEAAEVGVTIVLEHIPHGGSEQMENVVAIMERVPLLRFHLDSGHVKLERASRPSRPLAHLWAEQPHFAEGSEAIIPYRMYVVGANNDANTDCHAYTDRSRRQQAQAD